MSKIAIHGFGCIARSTLKAALQPKLFVPAFISDITDLSTLTALFAYDSSYGPRPDSVTTSDKELSVGDHKMTFVNTTHALPNWGELNWA